MKNPKAGLVDVDEGWRLLAVDVIGKATDDYYKARKGGLEAEADHIRAFLDRPSNPWANIADIDREFCIDIVTRVDVAIKKGEHYNAKRRA